MRLRSSLFTCLLLGIVLSTIDAKRFSSGGRRGGSSTRHRTPAPPSRYQPTSNNHFLDHERGSSSGTPNRGYQPSAPPAPKPPQTSGPIGFEGLGSSANQGNHKLGFDKVNSEAQNKPGTHVPSAPQYPVNPHISGPPHYQENSVPNGPPPAYPGYGNSYGGYPPAYPGRPINAPPSYSPSNSHYGQTNSYQPGFSSNYPYQGQGFPQQHFGFPNNFGSTYNQPNQFGSVGHGSYPSFGSSPYSGSYSGHSYQGNTFGGSPFGTSDYNRNAYYSPNNFGYSSNPGYFGSQPGYSGYSGQYNNYKKKSFLGGLPIPIPIPIPIPVGGGGFSGLGYGSNHYLLNSFIRNKETVNMTSGNSSTLVFVLNNSTVTPCTTDHFVYDSVKVTVVACTAEHCTAIKVSTTTNVSTVVSTHSVGLTMCLENNVTFSYFADVVSPSLSAMRHENITVCRNESNVSPEHTNKTGNGDVVTTDQTTTDVTTEATMTDATITTTPISTNNDTTSNITKVCDTVDCFKMEMCLPSVEVVERCANEDCPFKRTGYKPCLNLKMCRSPSAPVSSFASINTTVSKIDEYNHHNSVYDAANLTLISFHRPVISFNCSRPSSLNCTLT